MGNGYQHQQQAEREAHVRSARKLQLTLLRHGEPDWTPGGGLAVDNAGLTEFGRAQARAAAQALARHGVDAIYVSPLRRAQETALPLAEATGVAPITLEALAEIGLRFGGMTQEEVDRRFVEASRRPLSEHWEGWPSGENFRAFHARVTGGLNHLLALHNITPEPHSEFTIWHHPPDARLSLVIVAHGGTNAVLLTQLLDVQPVPWEWLRFESELAAYSVVQARPLGPRGTVWSLQNFNELDHLRAAGLR